MIKALRKAISKVANPSRRTGWELWACSESDGVVYRYRVYPIGTSDAWKRLGRRCRPRSISTTSAGAANKAFRQKCIEQDLIELDLTDPTKFRATPMFLQEARVAA